MLYAVTRVIRYTLEGVGRNIWLSLITITTITLTLLSLSLLITLHVGIDQIVTSAERRIDLSIYFFPEVTQSQAESVATSLKTLPGVTEIRVVSKEEALAAYTKAAQETPELVKPLEAIGENPFGASLTIKARAPQDFERVIAELSNEQYKGLIEGEQRDYEVNRSFIDNFRSFTQKIRYTAIAISGIFALIACLLLFNTMRVAIFTHREEIAIMKLVGASNWFIRGPFMVDALLYCLVATGIAAGVTLLALSYGQPSINAYFGIGEIDLFGFFLKNGVAVFAAEFGLIFLLSIFSTWLALRKYLRV